MGSEGNSSISSDDSSRRNLKTSSSSTNFRVELSSASHIIPTEDYTVASNSYHVTISENADAVLTYSALWVMLFFAGVLIISYLDLRIDYKLTKLERRREKDFQKKLDHARIIGQQEDIVELKNLPSSRKLSIDQLFHLAMPKEFSDDAWYIRWGSAVYRQHPLIQIMTPLFKEDAEVYHFEKERGKKEEEITQSILAECKEQYDAAYELARPETGDSDAGDAGEKQAPSAGDTASDGAGK